MASTQQSPTPARPPRVKPDTGKRVVQPKGDISKLPRPTHGMTAVRVKALVQEQQASKE